MAVTPLVWKQRAAAFLQSCHAKSHSPRGTYEIGGTNIGRFPGKVRRFKRRGTAQKTAIGGTSYGRMAV